MKCGFHSDCDVVNGSITCVCPGSGSRQNCSDDKKPVCGSDGKIYDNICHLMNASCQQQVVIQPAVPEKCGKRAALFQCSECFSDQVNIHHVV